MDRVSRGGLLDPGRFGDRIGRIAHLPSQRAHQATTLHGETAHPAMNASIQDRPDAKPHRQPRHPNKGLSASPLEAHHHAWSLLALEEEPLPQSLRTAALVPHPIPPAVRTIQPFRLDGVHLTHALLQSLKHCHQTQRCMPRRQYRQDPSPERTACLDDAPLSHKLCRQLIDPQGRSDSRTTQGHQFQSHQQA